MSNNVSIGIEEAIRLVDGEAKKYNDLAESMVFKTQNNLKYFEYKHLTEQWESASKAIKELTKRETVHWVWDENGNDWGIPAWVCSRCHHKNDMLPTHTYVTKDKMERVENPYIQIRPSKFGGSFNLMRRISGKQERLYMSILQEKLI